MVASFSCLFHRLKPSKSHQSHYKRHLYYAIMMDSSCDVLTLFPSWNQSITCHLYRIWFLSLFCITAWSFRWNNSCSWLYPCCEPVDGGQHWSYYWNLLCSWTPTGFVIIFPFLCLLFITRIILSWNVCIYLFIVYFSLPWHSTFPFWLPTTYSV